MSKTPVEDTLQPATLPVTPLAHESLTSAPPAGPLDTHFIPRALDLHNVVLESQYHSDGF